MDVEKLTERVMEMLTKSLAESVIDNMLPKAEEAIIFTATELMILYKWLAYKIGSAENKEVKNGAYTRYRKLKNKKRG